jgi:hypothetical protein
MWNMKTNRTYLHVQSKASYTCKMKSGGPQFEGDCCVYGFKCVLFSLNFNLNLCFNPALETNSTTVLIAVASSL